MRRLARELLEAFGIGVVVTLLVFGLLYVAIALGFVPGMRMAAASRDVAASRGW